MTQAHSWSRLAAEFPPDGQFRYIDVENVTSADWQSVLDLLNRQGRVISFLVDGVAEPLPVHASRLLEAMSSAALRARIQIEAVEYDWLIETPTMLSFSLCPTVRSASEFAGMCRFVELLNLATSKCVEINLEGASPIGRFAGPTDGFVWFADGGASTH